MKKNMMIMVIMAIMVVVMYIPVQAQQDDSEEVKATRIRFLSDEELQSIKRLRYVTETSQDHVKRVKFLSDEEISRIEQCGYITEESPKKSGEELVKEILDNYEVTENPGCYVITKGIMDDIRKYTKEVPGNSTSTVKRSWILTDKYSLILLFEDRNFYLVDTETQMSVRLQINPVSSESNADTDVTFNHPGICWGEETAIVSDGKFSVWRLGEKINEIDLLSEKQGEILTIDNFNKKVYSRANQTVYVWNEFEDTVNVVCNDFANQDFEIFSQTFFYIDTKGYVSMVNLIDECKITLQKQAIGVEAFNADMEHVCAIDIDGTISELPGYFNQDGKFSVWK